MTVPVANDGRDDKHVFSTNRPEIVPRTKTGTMRYKIANLCNEIKPYRRDGILSKTVW